MCAKGLCKVDKLKNKFEITLEVGGCEIRKLEGR